MHIFFILSAFGLTLSLSRARKIYWRDWYFKRFVKLLIPYYISVGIILLSLFIAHKGGLNLGVISATIFLYRGFVGRYVMAINPTWWFVITILEFYLIFPILLWLFRRFRFSFVFCALVINVLFQYFYASVLKTENLVFARFFLCFIFEFSLGIYLADIFVKNKDHFWNSLTSRKAVILGLSCEAIGIYLAFNGSLGKAYNDIFNGIGFSLLVLNIDYFLARFKYYSVVMSAVGKYSLAIFLLHAPYIGIFFGNFKGTGFANALLFLVPYCLFVTALSLVFTKLILQKTPLLKNYFSSI